MTFFFGTNLKMHGTPAQTTAFVEALEAGLKVYRGTNLQPFVLPPFTSLPGLSACTERLWLGAQNMHWADEGAYTGEISPVMLRALGTEMVLLGHAERRHTFGETDELIRKKVESAARRGLRVLLCVGETGLEKERGTGIEVVSAQLETALSGLGGPGAERLLVAYEPVWAIGACGREAKPGEVRASLRGVRKTLRTLFAHDVPVLYGGSVNEENCAAYASLPETDGLFVGRAAWRATGFLRVLALSLEARRAVQSSISVSERSP